jgi:hypothetical protein
MFDLDYFQGQITKYIMRWKLKNGLQDLEKAHHFLEKYIELVAKEKDLVTEKDVFDVMDAMEEAAEPGPGYVNQDPDLKPGDRPCNWCKANTRDREGKIIHELICPVNQQRIDRG